ncbi:MAG: hypothetical protein GY796_20045, partial [Chloroflexi bacterium]|nr:hypothetical protein [Chloroflexota bacterium]
RDLSGLAYLWEFSEADRKTIRDMDWSKKQIDLYIAYVKATRLLVDCLPLAMVSDRAGIEDQLLLPAA